MSTPYLEVTYRQGKPLAAYLYLDRRPGDHSARTERHGSLVVDFTADGRPIGIEFISVTRVDLEKVNAVLTHAHQSALSPTDLAPLTAA